MGGSGAAMTSGAPFGMPQSGTLPADTESFAVGIWIWAAEQLLRQISQAVLLLGLVTLAQADAQSSFASIQRLE